MTRAWKLGVVGGSGLYDLEGLEHPTWIEAQSPWGAPSDALLSGRLHGVELVFLPRHGRGHRLAPHELNARANIDVLKRAGCTDLLSISAVGSLREALAPGTFAIARQFIDRTRQRPPSFFGGGVVGHVSLAEPVCGRLSDALAAACAKCDAPASDGAVYLAIEGPQFSTRAESALYRSWGCDVIGMTSMPEARLAREAELPYANLCMITDYDCWREVDETANVREILRRMRSNVVRAKELLSVLVAALPSERAPSSIDTCLDDAVVSDPAHWSPEARQRLEAVAGRRLRRAPG